MTSLTVVTIIAGLLTSASHPASASPPPRVDNPYAGAEVYVNPEWSANAAAEPGGAAVADQDADLIQLTLYNVPGRDCDRLVSWGDLSVDELARYRSEYVDPIAEILADPAYASLRIVTIIEPNSVPNLVSHTSPRDRATFLCDQALQLGTYLLAIGYALAKLGEVPTVYNYLDISHHGQLGWPDNAVPAAELYHLAATASGSTVDNVHGLVANTANYSVLREEYFSVDDIVNGQLVREASRWIDWNSFVDEVPYAHSFRDRLVAVGFRPDLGLLIDTSRNGWGGPDRPTGPGPRTDPDEYVEASRLDRRVRVWYWCNQAGSGLGERPTAAPAPGIDAYVWIKPPGESDGASDPLGANRPYEPMCDPDYAPPQAAFWPTGACRTRPRPGSGSRPTSRSCCATPGHRCRHRRRPRQPGAAQQRPHHHHDTTPSRTSAQTGSTASISMSS